MRPYEGRFKSAETRYADVDQVDVRAFEPWCREARHIQWDYRNIVRHKGRLERLKQPGSQDRPGGNAVVQSTDRRPRIGTDTLG